MGATKVRLSRLHLAGGEEAQGTHHSDVEELAQQLHSRDVPTIATWQSCLRVAKNERFELKSINICYESFLYVVCSALLSHTLGSPYQRCRRLGGILRNSETQYSIPFLHQ